MWNPFDFTGKRILVTGATSGIGQATAIRLTEQGAQVCILARNEEKIRKTMEKLAGEGHQYYVKDFSEPGGYKEIFDSIVQDGHKIDGMVYCAGAATIVPVGMLNKNTMDETMTTNFYGFAEMVSQLSKKKYHDRASIVGISAISALYPRKCQNVYVASKAAMNMLVSASALELAAKHIRINTVMPGFVNTPMLQQAYEDLSEEELKELVHRQILGMEEPTDIANIIMFLLSDAARMITGRQIFADGGFLNFMD